MKPSPSHPTYWFALLVATTTATCTPGSDPSDTLGTGSSALETGEPIGTLPGSLSVSRTGAATYELPIDVPPGRGGMAPALSLAYNSRAGNGMVGVGWSLRGLSQITRCPSSVAYGGRTGGVGFHTMDQLCLDGAPLVVASGTYGAGDAEYRTADDRQARIVTNGVFSDGTPKSFTVYYKDGQIGRFRARLESRRVSSTTLDGTLTVTPSYAVYAWAQDIVEDRSGNYLAVEWWNGRTADEGVAPYPLAIRYTYSTGGSTGPSTRLIRFEYETRPDPIDAFVSGFHHHTNLRLASIDTFTLNEGKYETVHSYKLAYHADTITARSVLESIQKCDGADTCLPKTLLFTSAGDYAHDVPVTVSPIGGPAPSLRAADIDGDGLDDILWKDATSPAWKLQLRTSSGFTSPVEIHPWAQILALTDYDLDGDVDLILRDDGLAGAGVYTWQSGALVHVQHLDSMCGYPAVPKVADLDGDGAPDLIYRIDDPASTSAWKWRRNTRVAAAPFGPEQHTGFGEPYGTSDSIGAVVRLLGNGSSQVVFDGGDRFRFLFWAVSSVDSGVMNVSPDWTTAERIWPRFLDINGDGLDDLLDLTTGRMRINTGWGFGPEYDVLGPNAKWWQPPQTVPAQHWTPEVDSGIRIVDLNNDGRMDLARGGWGGGPGEVCISDGRWLHCEPYLVLHQDQDPDHPGYPYDFLDVDGDGVQDLMQVKGGVLQVWRRTGVIADRIESVRNGLGATDSVVHTTTTNPAVYTPGPACSYPQRCNARRIPVVARLERANGPGWNPELYTYADGRFDLRGEGFLGFAQTRRTDEVRGRTVEQRYELGPVIDGRFAGLGLPIRSTTFQRLRSDQVRVTTTAFVNSGWEWASGAKFKRPVSETREEYEWTNVGGIPIPSTSQPLHGLTAGLTPFRKANVTRSFDPYANLIGETREVAGGTRTVVAYDYDLRLDDWLIALVSRRHETSTLDGEDDAREVVYEYDEKGRRTRETIEPTRPELTLVTQYVRASDGLIDRILESGPSDPTRKTELFYDPERVFVSKVRNSLGHTTQYRTNRGLGVVERVRDPNGAETHLEYDTFGRLRRRSDADGRITTSSLVVDGPSSVAFRLIEEVNTGEKYWTDFDLLERPTAFAQELAAGRTIIEQRYDQAGRIQMRSLPRFEGESVSWVVSSHDLMGRTVRIDFPDGSRQLARYSPLKAERWDQTDRYTVHERNTDGLIARSVNRLDGSDLATTYNYGPFGRLARVIDSAGNTTDAIKYDSRGRRIAIENADAGMTTLAYNAFGELVKTTDPLGRDAVMHRDALGRIVEIHDVEGKLTEFLWDTSVGPLGARILGALHKAISPDDIGTSFEYDAIGRRVEKRLEVGSTTFKIRNEFDAVGRPSKITYPSSPAGGLDVMYTYGSDGLLEAAHSGTTTWWKALARDPELRILREQVGSGAYVARTYEPTTRRLARIESYRMVPVGTKAIVKQPFQDLQYSYFANGYLATREDLIEGRSETFDYDDVNRLTRWTMEDPVASGTYGYKYDDLGNLIHSNDLDGTHTYGHGVDAGPHAVTSIDGVAIAYDALGRRTASPGASISYTPFDLPRTITTSGGDTRFKYDAFQTRTIKASELATTIYLDGVYERREVEGKHTHHFTIQAGGRAVAEVVENPDGTTAVRYLHPDHLGSANVLTSDTGVILDRRAYTPFGDKLGAAVGGATSHTGGFTGHEGDWAEGLVNMRGRVYDPRTRRFLSPDPHVTRPDLGQNFNRYSYVLNAPLTFVDPTGLDWVVTDYDEGDDGGSCSQCDFDGSEIHQGGSGDGGGSPGPGFTYAEYGEQDSSQADNGYDDGYDDGYGASWGDGYGDQSYDDYGHNGGYGNTGYNYGANAPGPASDPDPDGRGGFWIGLRAGPVSDSNGIVGFQPRTREVEWDGPPAEGGTYTARRTEISLRTLAWEFGLADRPTPGERLGERTFTLGDETREVSARQPSLELVVLAEAGIAPGRDENTIGIAFTALGLRGELAYPSFMIRWGATTSSFPTIEAFREDIDVDW